MRMSSEVDPREAMRALAARFPGALREIDELPLSTIEERIDALDRALSGTSRVPRWALVLSDYHGWMRAALAMRRAAGASRDRAAALRWLDTEYVSAPDAPTREELLAALDAILKPPDGRLNRWLFDRLAHIHGASCEEVESEAFPTLRR